MGNTTSIDMSKRHKSPKGQNLFISGPQTCKFQKQIDRDAFASLVWNNCDIHEIPHYPNSRHIIQDRVLKFILILSVILNLLWVGKIIRI